MTDSWYLKLDRAQKHLDEFDAVVAAYVNKRPYRAIRSGGKCKEHRKCWRYHLEITEQPPAELAVILGDAVHNLRSALDHIRVALVPSSRKYSTTFPIIAEDVERRWWFRKWFPFLKSEAEASFDSAVRGMRPEAVAIVREAQPYQLRAKGAEKTHLLAILGRLDNADKHRQLIVLSTGLANAATLSSARDQALSQPAAPQVLLQDGAQVAHFLPPQVTPPVRDDEVNVEVRGTQLITVEVGLGSDVAFRVEAIHALVPQMRDLFDALDSYVLRPKALNTKTRPPKGGPEAMRLPEGRK